MGAPVALSLTPGSGQPPVVRLGLSPLTGRARATLALGSVAHEPRAGGLDITPADYAPPPMSAELFDPTAPDVVIGSLSDSFSRSFSDVFNGDGSASLSVLRDDPIVPELHSPRMIRFKYKGRYAFLAAIGPRRQQTLAAPGDSGEQPEEAAEIVTVSCTEALHALSKAVCLPSRFFDGPNPLPKEQDRQFNAGSTIYDATAWPYAVTLQRQGDPSPITTPGYGWDGQPPAFVDPDAGWCAASGCTVFGAPSKSVLHARRGFLIGTIGGTGVTPCRLYYGFDDAGTIFLDGQQIAEELAPGSRLSLRYVDFDLSDGGHVLYFVVYNGETDGLLYNPLGYLYSLQLLENQAAAGVMFDAGTIPSTPMRSSGYDQVLLNPTTAPGLTTGQVILSQIFDLFGVNQQTWWTVDFSTAADSNGVAWPILPNFVAHVGDDLRSVFRAIITAGLADITVDPYRPLIHAYIGGTFGGFSGVTCPPPTEGVDQSLAELTHDSDDPRATHLLVEYANGRTLVEAPGFDPMTTEKVVATLDLGKVPDVATATAWASALLAKSSVNFDAPAAVWEPADAAHDPYVNPRLIPGNYVDVPNGTLDGVRRQQLLSVTIAENDENADDVTITPEFNDLVAVEEQLVRQWLQRSAPGQMGGLYPIGSTPVPVTSAGVEARTPGFNMILGDVAGSIVDSDVHLRCQLREAVLTRLAGTPPVPSTAGTSVALLYVDSTLIATVTISAGQSTARVALANQTVAPNLNRLTARLDTSNGARHSLQVRTEAAG